MIRISKPPVGPRILSKSEFRGRKKTKEMKDAFDAGQRDFGFISDIYGAKSVKNALIAAQHDKCCFCESKIRHISHGDVEHFRPKAGWVQNDAGDLTKPGYYWLAYDWSNLFLSCQICNQRHKKNLFPLKNPSARAQSHHANIDDEDPFFLTRRRMIQRIISVFVTRCHLQLTAANGVVAQLSRLAWAVKSSPIGGESTSIWSSC